MKKIFLVFAVCLSYYYSMPQIVQTKYGSIEGFIEDGVYTFLGIPYAKPPINELRWRESVFPEKWDTLLIAKEFKPACPQKQYKQGDTTYQLIGKEDCLYLNIWTPTINPDKKAVMVFIHGGGNQQGSANEISGGTYIYYGKNLSKRGDVVVVTIQYRLGALGYLVHPGLEEENDKSISGNYGVFDQILALKWIKENIHLFGGDPNNVTIFGESAGGLNVGNLLTTPKAKGLFHRAIIQSAAPLISKYEDAKIKGIKFVNEYVDSTLSNKEKINLMRQIHADSLTIKNSQPLKGGIVEQQWQPVVDKYVFYDYPRNIFESKNFNDVPLIIGSNSEEVSLTAPPVITPSMVTLLINSFFPTHLREKAKQLYPPGNNNTEARISYIALLTDAQFTANVRRTAECISANTDKPVWRYYFTHQHTVQILKPYGAYHGMELFYVFNNWENATLGSGPLFKDTDKKVQDLMLAYWTNFAKTGNPNGNDLLEWKEFKPNYDCYINLNANPDNTKCGLLTDKCDLLDEAINYKKCYSTVTTTRFDVSEIFYPSITQDYIFISNNISNSIEEIYIISCEGKQVLIYKNKEQILDVRDLSNGLYFICFKTRDSYFYDKFIKF